MANIRPFCAVHYNINQVNLDKVTFTQEDNLPLELDPHHIKQILNPLPIDKERSQFVRYARSNALLQNWKHQQILTLNPSPAFYIYEQHYQKQVRINLLCLLKLENLKQEDKSVLSSQMQEQLRLLESTYTHFEPVVGLYNDQDQKIKKLLNQVPLEKVISLKTDQQTHQIYRFYSPKLSQLFQQKKIEIIQGQDHYKIALEFQENLLKRPKERATDYILANLASVEDLPKCLTYTQKETELWEILSTLNLKPCDTEKFKQIYCQIGTGNPKEIGIMFPQKGCFIISSMSEEKIIEKLEKFSPLNSSEKTHSIEEVKKGRTTIFIPPYSLEDLMNCETKSTLILNKSVPFEPKMPKGLLFWSLSDESGFI